MASSDASGSKAVARLRPRTKACHIDIVARHITYLKREQTLCNTGAQEGTLRRGGPLTRGPTCDKGLMIYFFACTSRHARTSSVPCT